MKFWKYAWVLLFASAHLFADAFVGNLIDEDLDVVYTYSQGSCVVGLSDGSCWQLLPLREKRKQSWTEWWKGQKPKEWHLSDAFFFDPADWKGKFKVSVHEARDSIATGYRFILVNQESQEKIFAQFLAHGSELLPKIEYAKTILDGDEMALAKLLCCYKFVDDVIVLDDKTIWQLHLFEKQGRSFSQWWRGEEIDQPDEPFISSLSDWNLFDEIAVHHSVVGDQELAEKYGVSQREQELYLVENHTSGKVAYATEVPFKNLLNMLYEHAENERKRGYSEGYAAGKSAGHQEGYREGKQEVSSK